MKLLNLLLFPIAMVVTMIMVIPLTLWFLAVSLFHVFVEKR